MRATMKFLGLAILAGMFLVGTPGVAGAANENASCFGVLADAFTGEGDVDPTGLADAINMVKAIAEFVGIPFGQLVSMLLSIPCPDGACTVDFCLGFLMP